MKLKHLIALTALALGLASGGVGAPAIAGGNGGINGGDVHAGLAAPALAGSKLGIGSGSNAAPEPGVASIRGGSSGDFKTEAGGPAVAGAKPGIASGTNNA